MKRHSKTDQGYFTLEEMVAAEREEIEKRRMQAIAKRLAAYHVNMAGYDQPPSEDGVSWKLDFTDWLDDPPQGGDAAGLGRLHALYPDLLTDEAGDSFAVINAELKAKGLQCWTPDDFEETIRRTLEAADQAKDAPTIAGHVPAGPHGRPATARSKRVRRIMFGLDVRETRAWNIEKHGTIDGDQQRQLAKIFADDPHWSKPEAWAYRKGRNTLVR